ncbi:NUDIX hydrolase [Paludifilum halophilum]|uniref:NUDIX hydrolase n=1 Tax=Paludifilum halophilum TaxID=1642702 RepID=A0A235B776_9BACL|nr:NUDIX hydrolase [Paludifilum halophilum]
MQRIANCILTDKDQVLLLKKPRRGWWVAPGGKMEPSETILDTVCREFEEETGLILQDPVLSGVFTMRMENKGFLEKEWMMFTFRANRYKGKRLEQSLEGELCWKPVASVPRLPTSGMDRKILTHLLTSRDLFIGKIVYTPDEQLIDYTFSSNRDAL